MSAPSTDSDAAVAHDSARRRFTLRVEGHEAGLDYELRDGSMVITHTGVPPAVEGRGLASQLTRAAFEHARAAGWKVRPACTYAAAWARRHPEYQSLLD